jgi:prolyl 4-hydroxylase
MRFHFSVSALSCYFVLIASLHCVVAIQAALQNQAPAEPIDLGTVPPLPSSWPGWSHRFRDDRYNQHLSYIQSHLVPNFTETGFLLQDTPPEVHQRLLDLFADRYHPEEPRHVPNESFNSIMATDDPSLPPVFVDISQHTRQLLKDLQPLHEAWAGLPLQPTHAFGLRIYQQGNRLKRHVDRLATHVISSIVHIASDLDEPWPIVIEDNMGVEHAVSLQPGQMLFYESARLPHARPSGMKGRHYTSVFVHYKPAEWVFSDESHAMRLINQHLVPDWDRDTEPQPKSFQEEHDRATAALHIEL